MPKSKICLPDINVWIALTSDLHAHHVSAKEWFSSLESHSAAFCRVTQMGFLRLISNPRVMGKDCVSQRKAWKFYEHMSRDERVFFASESAGVEEIWKPVSLSLLSGTNLWTDAYLAAFAQAQSWTSVTFDKGFNRVGVGFPVALLE
jgi:toxin-antitoxin system PIN domain toxin